jgi:hypothetical protein
MLSEIVQVNVSAISLGISISTSRSIGICIGISISIRIQYQQSTFVFKTDFFQMYTVGFGGRKKRTKNIAENFQVNF